MTIELPGNVEEQLQELALKQGREMDVIVEEAIRTYVEAAALTDLDPEDIAETQMALIGELRAFPSGRDSQ
jgi:predicted transcriptional regulator